MKKYVDMHIHSCYSDGTKTPEEILKEAASKNISVLSITDHDVIEGSRKLLSLPDKMGIRCVSGVELTTYQNGESYHILGYGFDLENDGFKKFVENNQQCLERVSTGLIKKMVGSGAKVSLEDYEKYYFNRKKGGWKALRYFMDCKAAGDIFDALSLYGKYGQDYSDVGFPDIESACAAIHNAGGKAVLAHPGRVMGGKNFKADLEKLIHLGLDGIECLYPSHSDEITEICLKICEEKGLLITCGSDSHGEFEIENTPMGIMNVTEDRIR